MKKIKVVNAFAPEGEKDVDIAAKVLALVDKGLVYGLGKPVPGKMCVEAAVSYAMGEGHNDQPSCVEPALASYKIMLNDEHGWNNNKARAKGLRRVAIAQLGSKGKFETSVFIKALNEVAAPLLFKRFKADCLDSCKATCNYHKGRLLELNNEIRQEVKELSSLKKALVMATAAKKKADKAFKAVKAAKKKAALVAAGKLIEGKLAFYRVHSPESLAYQIDGGQQKGLSMAAEATVQALKKMKIPGTKYLYLTEKSKSKKVTKRKKRL